VRDDGRAVVGDHHHLQAVIQREDLGFENLADCGPAESNNGKNDE
jgi:hypothetical protein